MAPKRKRDKDNDGKGEGSSAQAKSMLPTFFPFPPLPWLFDNSLTLQLQDVLYFPLRVYFFLPFLTQVSPLFSLCSHLKGAPSGAKGRKAKYVNPLDQYFFGDLETTSPKGKGHPTSQAHSKSEHVASPPARQKPQKGKLIKNFHDSAKSMFLP